YSGDGGPAVQAGLSLVGSTGGAVAVDGAGNLFIADTGNHSIREVDATTGDIVTVAGTGQAGYGGDGGPATLAGLNYPPGLAVSGSGDLYIADTVNNVIRKVDASSGLISTVAGTGLQGYSGDGGTATSATLYGPEALAVNAAGDLFIADTGNNVIRKVDAVSG